MEWGLREREKRRRKTLFGDGKQAGRLGLETRSHMLLDLSEAVPTTHEQNSFNPLHVFLDQPSLPFNILLKPTAFLDSNHV